MKVTPEQREAMEDAIARLLVKVHERTGQTEADVRARYRARDIVRGDAVQDIDKRFRWDLLNGAAAGTTLITDLYATGCNDVHIDTALRSIVSPL